MALFVALGGVSAAEEAFTSAARAISGKRLVAGSVTGAKIKNGTIARADLAPAVRAKLGVPGPAGPQGPTGPTGPAGPAGQPATVGADSIGSAEIKDGALKGADVGRFTGTLQDLPFGSVAKGGCVTATSPTLTPVTADQDLRDDAIAITPSSSFPGVLTYAARPAGATSIAVTVCNIAGSDPANVGNQSFRYVTFDSAGS